MVYTLLPGAISWVVSTLLMDVRGWRKDTSRRRVRPSRDRGQCCGVNWWHPCRPPGWRHCATDFGRFGQSQWLDAHRAIDAQPL